MNYELRQSVFYDICHYITNIQACSTNLLRDEARCCHAWRGVYLEEIDLLAFRDNVVDTDNAVTT